MFPADKDGFLRTRFSSLRLPKALKIFPGAGSEYTKPFLTKTDFGHHVDSFQVGRISGGREENSVLQIEVRLQKS